jgi:hypothetical protein
LAPRHEGSKDPIGDLEAAATIQSET